MVEGRRYHSCTVVGKTIYAYGGEGPGGKGRRSLEYYGLFDSYRQWRLVKL